MAVRPDGAFRDLPERAVCSDGAFRDLPDPCLPPAAGARPDRAFWPDVGGRPRRVIFFVMVFIEVPFFVILSRFYIQPGVSLTPNLCPYENSNSYSFQITLWTAFIRWLPYLPLKKLFCFSFFVVISQNRLTLFLSLNSGSTDQEMHRLLFLYEDLVRSGH